MSLRLSGGRNNTHFTMQNSNQTRLFLHSSLAPRLELLETAVNLDNAEAHGLQRVNLLLHIERCPRAILDLLKGSEQVEDTGRQKPWCCGGAQSHTMSLLRLAAQPHKASCKVSHLQAH